MIAGSPWPAPSEGFEMMSTAPASMARMAVSPLVRVSEEMTTVGTGALSM